MPRTLKRKGGYIGAPPKFIGEPGQKYKIYVSESNDPNEYSYVGTFDHSSREDGELAHEFIDIRFRDGSEDAKRTMFDSAVNVLYTPTKCRVGECEAGGRRKRRSTRKRRMTRRR